MDEHQFRELIGTERRLKFNRQPGNGGEGGFVYTVLSFICETVDGKVRTRNGYRIGEIRTGPYGQVIPSKKFIEKYPQFRNTKMIRTEKGLVFEDVDTPIIAVGEEGDTTLAAGRAIKACAAAKKSSRMASSKVARASAKKKAAAKTTKAAASKTAAAKDGETTTATKAKATAKKTAAKKTAAKTTKAATKTAKSASEAKAADVATAKTTKTAAKKTAAKTTKAAASKTATKATTAKTAKAATAKATKATASKASAAKGVKTTTGKKVDVKAHEKFMAMALEEAKKAEALGEVPVGAVLVTPKGEVVGRGCNRTIVDHDATAHAEVVALRRAGQFLENYRLNDLTMYVTLEPCCMCVMACVHARIKTIVFGAEDPKTGACASVFDLAADDRHNHRLEIVGGIMDKECSEILSSFFKTRRAQQKAAKPATKTVAKKATKTAKATKAAAKPATKKVTAAKKATAAKKTTAAKATPAKATATKAAAKTTKVAATKATATKATAAKAAKPAAKKATATKATATKAKATAKKTAAKPVAKKAAAKPAAKKATATKATAAKATAAKVTAPKAATEAKVAPAVKTDDKTKA